MPTAWNHSVHYHRLILEAVPRPCARVLDIGCGSGVLVSQLASLCTEVVGVDIDPVILPVAHASNVSFQSGDFLTLPLAPDSFNLVTAVAVLHHLPLRDGLQRMAELVRPGGVLMILGLFRPVTLADNIHYAGGWLASRILRLTRGYDPGSGTVQEPHEPLAEIRAAATDLLPGAQVKRRLLFRYTLVWTKPRI